MCSRSRLLLPAVVILITTLVIANPVRAEINGAPQSELVVRCGDSNLDGDVTFIDYLAYFNAFVGFTHEPAFCDFTGDGECRRDDLRLIIQDIRNTDPNFRIQHCDNPKVVAGDTNGDGFVSFSDYRFSAWCIKHPEKSQCPQAAKLIGEAELSACEFDTNEYYSCAIPALPSDDNIFACGVLSLIGSGGEVCGVSGQLQNSENSGGFKEFPDLCALQAGNLLIAVTALPGTPTYTLHNQGACPSGNQDCVCQQIYDPVCGKDGQTYSNLCEFHCAGKTDADLRHEGVCQDSMGLPECSESLFFGMPLGCL